MRLTETEARVLAGVTIFARPVPDPLAALRTGDRLRVDPAAGTAGSLNRR